VRRVDGRRHGITYQTMTYMSITSTAVMNADCPQVVELLRRYPAKKLWNGSLSPSYNFFFRDKPRSLIELQETSDRLIGVCCLYDKTQTEVSSATEKPVEADHSSEGFGLEASSPVNTTGVFLSPLMAEITRDSSALFPLAESRGFAQPDKSLKRNKASKPQKRKAKVVFGSQYREEPAPRPKSPIASKLGKQTHRARDRSDGGYSFQQEIDSGLKR